MKSDKEEVFSYLGETRYCSSVLRMWARKAAIEHIDDELKRLSAMVDELKKDETSVDYEKKVIVGTSRRIETIKLSIKTMTKETLVEPLVSCVGCKYLYSEGSGYSNYTWMETYVKCAKDKNPNLADGEAEEPDDWNQKADSDNWDMTNSSRCDLYDAGVYVELDVDGENGPGDESDDEVQILAICKHSGRERNGCEE